MKWSTKLCFREPANKINKLMADSDIMFEEVISKAMYLMYVERNQEYY